MSRRRTLPFAGAALALALLLAATAVRWSSAVLPRDRLRHSALSPTPPRVAGLHGTDPAAAGLGPMNTAERDPNGDAGDKDPTSAALEELATRDPQSALATALDPSNDAVRRSLLAAVLRGWARADVAGAGAWIRSQSHLDRRFAHASLFSGAVSRPDDAVRFALETRLAYPDEAEWCSAALVSALCDAGSYEHAARFVTLDPGADGPERLKAIFLQWGGQAPQSAWRSALALEPDGLRLAALEGATHAWSQADAGTLADTARVLPTGPERALALTMAIRAWLDRDLDGAAAWLIRWVPSGALVGVDIDLLLEQ